MNTALEIAMKPYTKPVLPYVEIGYDFDADESGARITLNSEREIIRYGKRLYQNGYDVNITITVGGALVLEADRGAYHITAE